MLPTSSISLRKLSPDYILIYMKIMCTVVSFISIGKFSSKCYLELIVLYLAYLAINLLNFSLLNFPVSG